MFETLLLTLGTAGIVHLSLPSLRKPGSHGFYRFFVFEALLALFVLNMRSWFLDPFAAHQLLSWAFLLGSLYLVIASMTLLRGRGKPGPSRQDTALLGLERTTRLVTEGIYRRLRHPMYASLLYLGWGVFFKDPSWLAFALVCLVTFFLYRTARIEEMENLRYFGEAYAEYMQHTRRFIPFVF